MEFVRLTSASGELFEQCLEVYQYSFPRCERRSVDNLARVISDTRCHFMAVVDGAKLLGVVCYWHFETDAQGFVYLEHLAIATDGRNCGLGAQCLSLLKSMGARIILEVEPPMDEMTTRRVGFYTREGFVMNVHHHIQPPYHSDEPSLDLRIMSWPEAFCAEDYQRFADSQNSVMPAF